MLLNERVEDGAQGVAADGFSRCRRYRASSIAWLDLRSPGLLPTFRPIGFQSGSQRDPEDQAAPASPMPTPSRRPSASPIGQADPAVEESPSR